MNTVYLFVEIALAFAGVVAAYKLIGKNGLYAWIAVASVAANIITAKTSNVFGMAVAQGTVLFASNFLATDILCEKYGSQCARKGVIIGLLSTLTFMVAAQVALLYAPSEFDYADGAMRTLFGLNLRISLSSMVMYLIANLADVYLFSKIKEKTGGRYLWLRNNVATIVCNCAENFAFIFMAFIGIYTAAECVEIAITTSIVEAIVAICDTPFLYAAMRVKAPEE